MTSFPLSLSIPLSRLGTPALVFAVGLQMVFAADAQAMEWKELWWATQESVLGYAQQCEQACAPLGDVADVFRIDIERLGYRLYRVVAYLTCGGLAAWFGGVDLWCASRAAKAEPAAASPLERWRRGR